VVTAAGGTVKVTGLAELRKALKAIGEEKSLAEVNHRIATEIVSGARGRASSRMESSAAGRLRASKSAVSSRVILGGKPYDLGAEFGAGQNKPRSRKSGSYLGYNSFKPWRGNGEGAGYFLYPTIRDNREALQQAYGDEIEKRWANGG
jgi:hypothetical protein